MCLLFYTQTTPKHVMATDGLNTEKHEGRFVQIVKTTYDLLDMRYKNCHV